jgi:hypothetical protein
MNQDEIVKKWKASVKEAKEGQKRDVNAWRPIKYGALSKAALAQFTAKMIKTTK